MLKLINYYSGALTLLSIICAIIFHFVSLSVDLADVKETSKKSAVCLTGVQNALQDHTRDHEAFQRSIEESNRIQRDMVRVLDRLEITLTLMRNGQQVDATQLGN